MIYDNFKKILKEKYELYQNRFSDNIIEDKFLSKETINNNPYFIIFENEKYTKDEIEYLNKLPKGFTYRPVNEYIELIMKIINDIQTKYIKDLTEEQTNYINKLIDDYQKKMEILPKEESLQNSIEFWKILIDATKLYKYARDKSLENIKSKFTTQKKEKSSPKTNKMTISDYEKELDKRVKRKRGIEDLIAKIKSKDNEILKPEELQQDLLTRTQPPRTKEDEIRSLTSMEKFLLSVKDDINQTMYKTAFDAIQNAKNDPSIENIQLAKELIDKALES